MKKLAIAARSLMLVIAVTAASCSNADNKDAAAVTTGQPAAAATASINIRYVDIDTVMSYYNLSKELNEQGRKLMLDYQRIENQKRNEIQNLGASIEQKRNANGYLSQESFDADVNSFNRKQNEAANILGAHQEKIQKQLADFDRQLNDSVNNFIKEFNAKRGYDAILYRASGLYFNPALDITQEVIEGLNARYTAPRKEDKKDAK